MLNRVCGFGIGSFFPGKIMSDVTAVFSETPLIRSLGLLMRCDTLLREGETELIKLEIAIEKSEE